MRHVKNLIVGCGFSGAVLARKLAEDSQEDVLMKTGFVFTNTERIFFIRKIKRFGILSAVLRSGILICIRLKALLTEWKCQFRLT